MVEAVREVPNNAIQTHTENGSERRGKWSAELQLPHFPSRSTDMALPSPITTKVHVCISSTYISKQHTYIHTAIDAIFGLFV